jgi:hypothetical protein
LVISTPLLCYKALLAFQQFRANNLNVVRRFDPNGDVAALHLEDFDYDIFTNADRLACFPTQNQHMADLNDTRLMLEIQQNVKLQNHVLLDIASNFMQAGLCNDLLDCLYKAEGFEPIVREYMGELQQFEPLHPNFSQNYGKCDFCDQEYCPNFVDLKLIKKK